MMQNMKTAPQGAVFIGMALLIGVEPTGCRRMIKPWQQSA
jgi:hypothetical protein